MDFHCSIYHEARHTAVSLRSLELRLYLATHDATELSELHLAFVELNHCS